MTERLLAERDIRRIPSPSFAALIGDADAYLDYAFVQMNFDLADALFRTLNLDLLLAIHGRLKGAEHGWKGDFHKLSRIFEHVNAAVAAVGGDCFLRELALEGPTRRAAIIDAIVALLTDSPASDFAAEQVKWVRAMRTAWAQPSGEGAIEPSIATAPAGFEASVWRALVAALGRYAAIERAWLACSATTDAALEAALGERVAPPSIAEAAAVLSKTALSDLFENALAVAIRHGKGASTGRVPGRGVGVVGASGSCG